MSDGALAGSRLRGTGCGQNQDRWKRILKARTALAGSHPGKETRWQPPPAGSRKIGSWVRCYWVRCYWVRLPESSFYRGRGQKNRLGNIPPSRGVSRTAKLSRQNYGVDDVNNSV